MADLKNRKIEMFRAHLDPAIGPKPKLAWTVGSDGVSEMEITPAGVYVKWTNSSPGNSGSASDHLVPFSNVQSIRFVPIKE